MTGRLRAVALLVCAGWLIFALVAMLVSSGPALGPVDGSAQHVIVGAVLVFVVAAAVAVMSDISPPSVGWASVFVACVSLLAFELLQIAVPVRSFQWSDLAYGITGVTGGALLIVLALHSRDRFIAIVAVGGGMALVLAVIGLVVLPSDQLSGTVAGRLSDCSDAARPEPLSWDLVVLKPSDDGSGCVTSATGPLVPFGAPLVSGDGGSSPDGGVVLDGGGLISAPLSGLGAAIQESGAVTFGLRFSSNLTPEEVVPIVLARLTIGEDPARPVTQLLQRGEHLTANVGSGRPVVGIGLPLIGRARPGSIQELVMTYDAGKAIVYLDGELISESTTEPFVFAIDDELTLVLGWRIDERWEPLDGTVHAVVIADRVLTQHEIRVVFNDR